MMALEYPHDVIAHKTRKEVGDGLLQGLCRHDKDA